MRTKHLLAATSLLAGCTSPALDLAPTQPDRPWSPATNADGEIVPGKAAAAATSHVLPSNPALATLAPTPAVDPAHEYTLPELIDLAQNNHPETRIAWARARQAALAAGIAESAYLPHLSASVLGAHQSSHGESSALGVGADNGASATGAISALSLQWLLFDFGQREAVVESAQQLSVASNIAFTAAHQRVIYDVCLAFYADAAARARVEVAEKSLRNALEIEAAASDRHQHGIGTVIEVAQASQASAQARLAAVQAAGQAQNTHVELVAATGVSPLAAMKVAPLPKRTLSMAMTGPVDGIVAEALGRRPDMLSSYALQKAAAAQIRAAEADFKPKLFFSATGTYNSGRLGVSAIPSVGQELPTLNVSGTRWGSTLLLGLTVPLYDAGLRRDVLQQAKANADKAAATLERVRDQAVQQIVVARNALSTSLAAYEASSALEAAARTTFDAALDAYRQGVGSVTQATGAETQLLQARSAAADAYSAALAAAATLAFATGSLGAAPHER